jgi:ADP-ribose pyrophosphatase YjhB (NUDIX family)
MGADLAELGPRVGCGAVIIVDRRILLIRRLKSPEALAWGLPGGKVDAFEPLLSAITREVAEELGITLKAPQFLCNVEYMDREAGQHWISAVFQAHGYDGDPKLMEPDKHGGFGWFALDELPQPLTWATVCALDFIGAKTI